MKPAGRARGAAASRGGTTRGAAARQRPARAGQRDDDRYDLLTAALIGAAVGATAMLLVRSGGTRKVVRPLAGMAMSEVGRMALKAGTGALSARALTEAGRHAGPMAREAASNLGDYVRTARSAIDEFLADEVRDLRKAIRRGRRRAGL